MTPVDIGKGGGGQHSKQREEKGSSETCFCEMTLPFAPKLWPPSPPHAHAEPYYQALFTLCSVPSHCPRLLSDGETLAENFPQLWALLGFQGA